MLLGIAGDADRHLRMLVAMYLVEAHHFIATELHTEPGPAWERTLAGFASRGIDVVVMNVRTDIAGAVIHRRSGHLLYLGAWSQFQRSLALPAGDYELLPANSMRKLYMQLDFVVGNIAFGGTLQ